MVPYVICLICLAPVSFLKKWSPNLVVLAKQWTFSAQFRAMKTMNFQVVCCVHNAPDAWWSAPPPCAPVTVMWCARSRLSSTHSSVSVLFFHKKRSWCGCVSALDWEVSTWESMVICMFDVLFNPLQWSYLWSLDIAHEWCVFMLLYCNCSRTSQGMCSNVF